MTGYQQAAEDYQARSPSRRWRSTEQTKAGRDEVMALGGLFILGTERTSSGRVDNQLRGRAGRQR